MNTINLPTYQSVVLESRAHRVLKVKLAAALRSHGVTVMQWSIIGLIATNADGMRISDLARSLDTSLAFVTTTVNTLQQKGLVVRTGHSHDSRSKLVSLEPGFAAKVPAIEAELTQALQEHIYSGLSDDALAGYFAVVRHIASAA